MSWEEVLKRTPDYEFGDAPRTDTYEKDTQTRLKVINEFLPVLKKYESFIKAHSDRVEKLEDDRVELNKMVKELDKFPKQVEGYNILNYVNPVGEPLLEALQSDMELRIRAIDKFVNTSTIMGGEMIRESYLYLLNALEDNKNRLTQNIGDRYDGRGTMLDQARGEFP